jgi:hypothetical protein
MNGPKLGGAAKEWQSDHRLRFLWSMKLHYKRGRWGLKISCLTCPSSIQAMTVLSKGGLAGLDQPYISTPVMPAPEMSESLQYLGGCRIANARTYWYAEYTNVVIFTSSRTPPDHDCPRHRYGNSAAKYTAKVATGKFSKASRYYVARCARRSSHTSSSRYVVFSIVY